MALQLCNTTTDEEGRELVQHGTAFFPIACYHDDLGRGPVPWHWHTELEIFTVSEGAAVVAAGTERFVVRQGEGVFINSGVLHAVWDHENSGCRLHSAVFHPRLVGGSVDSVFWQNYVGPLAGNSSLKSLRFDCRSEWHREAVRAIEEAWSACAKEPPCYELWVRDALSRLVGLLIRNFPAVSKPPAKRALRDEERMKTMIGYIRDHCREELTVAAIARSASIGESECLRCFRSVSGMPPMQYVKEFRLQRACGLLASTELGIAEIGARCGFLDASYFTKTFREWKGCTPSEYRRQETGRAGERDAPA